MTTSPGDAFRHATGGVARALAIGRHVLFALLLAIGTTRAITSETALPWVLPLVVITAAWYLVGTAWRRAFVAAGAGP